MVGCNMVRERGFFGMEFIIRQKLICDLTLRKQKCFKEINKMKKGSRKQLEQEVKNISSKRMDCIS